MNVNKASYRYDTATRFDWFMEYKLSINSMFYFESRSSSFHCAAIEVYESRNLSEGYWGLTIASEKSNGNPFGYFRVLEQRFVRQH